MFSNKTIVQIGSHIGDTSNDPIYNKIDKTTKLVLVEPVPGIFEILKQNYYKKNIQNIVFINKAVSDYIGDIKLTIPSPNNDPNKMPVWVSQLSSVNKDHCKNHISQIITEEIKVKTTTLDQIIKTYNLNDIYLLHIDTEGHDFTILMNYSFIIKPKIIMFEHKHIDGYLTVGLNYKTLINKLLSIGYKIKCVTDEDTTVEL